MGDGGQHVDGHHHGVGGGASGNLGGPFHEARDAGAALPAGAFALAQRPGAASVLAVAEPGAVVGGEDDPGVVFEAVLFERVHNLADGPVHLHHDIGEESFAGLALVLVAHKQGHMHHAVREVEKEGLVLVFLDELHAACGVVGGEMCLIFGGDLFIDDAVVFDHGELRISAFLRLRVVRPHVVRVRDAVVFIETVLHRQKLGQGTEMPFADGGGGVAFLLHELGDGHFSGVDAVFGRGTEGAVDADAVRIAASKQSRARGAAHRLGDVEVRELAA
jgi:hypothetical protein